MCMLVWEGETTRRQLKGEWKEHEFEIARRVGKAYYEAVTEGREIRACKWWVRRERRELDRTINFHFADSCSFS